MIPLFAFFTELTILGWFIVIMLFVSVIGSANKFVPYRRSWGFGDFFLLSLIIFIGLLHYYVVALPLNWTAVGNVAIYYFVGFFLYPCFEWYLALSELREGLEKLRVRWIRERTLSTDSALPKLTDMYLRSQNIQNPDKEVERSNQTRARDMRSELIEVFTCLSLNPNTDTLDAKADFAPRAEHHKSLLGYWAVWWPFIVLNRIFGDFLTWLCKLPGRIFRPLLNQLSSSMMKDV